MPGKLNNTSFQNSEADFIIPSNVHDVEMEKIAWEQMKVFFIALSALMLMLLIGSVFCCYYCSKRQKLSSRSPFQNTGEEGRETDIQELVCFDKTELCIQSVSGESRSVSKTRVMTTKSSDVMDLFASNAIAEREMAALLPPVHAGIGVLKN